jgi:hypothetical protein
VPGLYCCCMTTFLQRYQAGEFIAVWDDLLALGEKVRDRRYNADAVAVAAETMRRVRHNVELLINAWMGWDMFLSLWGSGTIADASRRNGSCELNRSSRSSSTPAI